MHVPPTYLVRTILGRNFIVSLEARTATLFMNGIYRPAFSKRQATGLKELHLMCAAKTLYSSYKYLYIRSLGGLIWLSLVF